MKPRKDPLKRTPFIRKAPRGDKPAKRPPMVKARRVMSPEERRARRLVKARSGGTCELWMCGGAPATDWSHRMRRSQLGPWCPTNGLASCRFCHSIITHDEKVGLPKGWCLKSYQDPATNPVYRRGEWVLLDDEGGWESVNPEALGGDAA